MFKTPRYSRKLIEVEDLIAKRHKEWSFEVMCAGQLAAAWERLSHG